MQKQQLKEAKLFTTPSKGPAKVKRGRTQQDRYWGASRREIRIHVGGQLLTVTEFDKPV